MSGLPFPAPSIDVPLFLSYQLFPHNIHLGKGLWNGCYILFLESLFFGLLYGGDFVEIKWG